MGLQALIDKYDNGSFPKKGWYKLKEDILQSEGVENQDKAIRIIGEIRKQGEEESKE